MLRNITLVLGLAVMTATLVGCSKGDLPLARVNGRVTLDGQPLARAAVMLTPTGGKGGPAYAVTDDNGQYELSYTHDRAGAVVGECLVRIKTGFQSVEDEDNKVPRPERVPARYNKLTELKVDVQPGGGPYNFDLKSK